MTLTVRRILPRPIPKCLTEIQRQGLRYERRVVKELRRQAQELEHNPWFEVQGWPEVRNICPDILVYRSDFILVIEVKLTHTPGAIQKLQSIYCPAVAAATGQETRPLVIAKRAHFPPGEYILQFHSSLSRAIDSSWPVYLWPGQGPIEVGF